MNHSLNRQIRSDANLALQGHWPMPVYWSFLLIAAFFAAAFLPEAVLVLIRALFPGLSLFFFTCIKMLFLVLFLLFASTCLAPLSLGMDHYFDLLAAGADAKPEDAFAAAKAHKKAARRLKSRMRQRAMLYLIPAGLLSLFPFGLSVYYFHPEDADTLLSPDLMALLAVQNKTVAPLLGCLCLLIGLLLVILALIAALHASVPGWLAPTLLLEGRVSTEAEALQLSRRLLTPHKKMLLSFMRSWMLPFALCVFILPLLFVLPRYGAGKALLCRYCLSKDSEQAAEAEDTD